MTIPPCAAATSLASNNTMFEVDYPHAAGTHPNTAAFARKMCDDAGLDDSERHQVFRGNAIRLYGLERLGLTA
jgi:predicted TIM-barrel fold metal-dependent hydrolase